MVIPSRIAHCHSKPQPHFHSELQTPNCHSEPKARNPSASQRGDPSHSLGMTSQRHCTRAWLRLSAEQSPRCRSEPQRRHCHSEPHRPLSFQAATPLSFRAATPQLSFRAEGEESRHRAARRSLASARDDKPPSLHPGLASPFRAATPPIVIPSRRRGISAPCSAEIPRVARDDGTSIHTGGTNLGARAERTWGGVCGVTGMRNVQWFVFPMPAKGRSAAVRCSRRSVSHASAAQSAMPARAKTACTNVHCPCT